MKETFIEGIKVSVADLFSKMLDMEIEFKGVRILNGGEKLTADISGIIGLAGNYTGSMSVHLNKNLSMKVTSQMLGSEVLEFGDEVEDCVGELANLIAGGAKTVLSSKGIDFNICIPTVVVGEGHQIASVSPDNQVILDFETNGGLMVVEMTIKEAPKKL